MRLLAIDLGAKRTGLALCDEAETIASPLAVLDGGGDVAVRIVSIAKDNQVQGVVLGLALNMDDTEGPAAKKCREFGAKLGYLLDVPVYFQDERLSSFAAEERLAGLGLTRKKKKGILDAIAAAEILQSFIDSKKQDSAQKESSAEGDSEA
ncbi:MAG: Holliday junction resolvase RuvX [Anaerohalosphaeraceae bacterium]|nr:Holliday junction resolvase RuvX [Anaerohalosphaeraceae bacterium]